MDGYTFPTPKAPTGPISDTPDLRAYVSDQYGEPCTDKLLADFFHDETQTCWRCEGRFMFEEIECVGDGWLCEDCSATPTRSSRRMRDPDERASL